MRVANPPHPLEGRVIVSSLVATLVFWAYTQTLLPGVDLGDTGGFQAAVLWPEVSARQAYPLYYGLARPFVAVSAPDNPARALNLFSALFGAIGAGLLTFVCATVTRSLAAGVAAGALLAFSYTFWTQAIIAEVYTLHLALIACCLLVLHRYATGPTTTRLIAFFAVYAAAFGNHFGMILLLVPFALFLVNVHPRPRELVSLRVVAAASAIAVLGALQYAPNLASVWGAFTASESWSDRFAAFWFDTTKQDWRETMVLGVEGERTTDRLAMWWFDSRQQFGIPGIAMALVGFVYLSRRARPWAVLVASGYTITVLFALTYNVGDPHVFFMPGHFLTALSAGAALAWLRPLRHRATDGPARFAAQMLCIAAVLAYAAWRGWSTWPAVDRHDDRRGEQVIASLVRGIDHRTSLLVADMDWQLENVLLYTVRHLRPDIAWVRLGDVMAHLPYLIDDNHAIGRDVVLSSDAAARAAGAYGPAFPLVEDTRAPSLAAVLEAVPRGAPYVLTVLTPLRETTLAEQTLSEALAALTDGTAPPRRAAAFELMSGLAGLRPHVHRSSDRPFTARFMVGEEPLTVRMDSWLPTDTFRRAGFGHVLRRRDQVLVVERGVSVAWVTSSGEWSAPFYAASLYAPMPRYRIPAATVQLAGAQPIGTQAPNVSAGSNVYQSATPLAGWPEP